MVCWQGGGEVTMSTSAQQTYQEWRESRIRHAVVAGIDVHFRVVSTDILEKCGPDLLHQLNEIDDMHVQRQTLDEARLFESPDNLPTRRDFASAMRKALEKILPEVLKTPEWLPQALGDFSESEIIELYNVVMHGTGTFRSGSAGSTFASLTTRMS